MSMHSILAYWVLDVSSKWATITVYNTLYSILDFCKGALAWENTFHMSSLVYYMHSKSNFFSTLTPVPVCECLNQLPHSTLKWKI